VFGSLAQDRPARSKKALYQHAGQHAGEHGDDEQQAIRHGPLSGVFRLLYRTFEHGATIRGLSARANVGYGWRVASIAAPGGTYSAEQSYRSVGYPT
jgi:hypothetical protein